MKHAIIGFLALMLVVPARAVEYSRLQADKSAISFVYQQMGVKMEGKFKKFSAAFRFDPSKPASANVAIDVELAMIDAGSDEADGEVVSKVWLNTKAFPTAHFASTNIKLVGANRYEVTGKLTIKGKSQDVVFGATLTTQGSVGAFDGAFIIHRADFVIGEGTWAKFDVVANDVLVKFHMIATSEK